MAEEWQTKVLDNKHDEINDFLKRKKSTGKSQRTVNEYSRLLKKFYHEHFPDLNPNETQVYHVEEFVSRLDDRDLSQNTKRRYVESLSAFFQWAMKRPRFEEITGNPAAVVLEELPRKRRERPDCATWENGKKIIKQIGEPRNKLAAIIMAKTGARITEVLKLEMDDLMLEDGFLRFRKRKGGKNTVNPIDDETIRSIQRYKFVRDDTTDEDFLFLSIRGDRVGRDQIRRAVRRAAVDAGIMKKGEKRFHKKFTPHTYRTVFTTVMRNQGLDDHLVRYLRGDADREEMDLYTRIDKNQLRRKYLEKIKTLNL